jgi:hypothetical protein
MKRIMAALIYGKHAALGNSRLNSTLPKKSGYTSQKLSSIGISHNTFVRKSRNKNQTACHRGQGAGHPGQVQQASGEGSGEGLGDFGAEKVLQKAPGGFGAEFRRRFRRRSGRLWSTLRCFQCLASQHASERFVKIKRCGCWGYHRSLFTTKFD